MFSMSSQARLPISPATPTANNVHPMDNPPSKQAQNAKKPVKAEVNADFTTSLTV
jgi:hypothetical protein